MSSTSSLPTTLDLVSHAPQQRALSLVFVGAEFVKSVVLTEGESLLVGRTAGVDVELSDLTVSRRHARFTLLHGQLYVEDAGSHNGVLVNGLPSTKSLVGSRDRVRIGSVDVIALGAELPKDTLPLQLTPSVFVSAIGEELVRSRYSQRPFWLAALRFHDASPSGDELEKLLKHARAVDRLCVHTPNIALLLLPEVDESGARSIANRFTQQVPQKVTTALLRCAHGSSAEALLGAAVDRVQTESGPPGANTESLPASSDDVVVGARTEALFELAKRTGHADLPVLLLGETGAGKEVVARAFHHSSRRVDRPFCEVNCATITPALAESLLFGHEKGAFTGADRRTAGLFEQAHGGTLFLDEVGELPLGVQGALLRALDTGRIRRVGAAQEITVDVRLIAATNRNLHDLVARGEFREDLLYRLEALTARVPPLRERVDEIEPLARLFLGRARCKWRAPVERLSPDAVLALIAYHWPGNVRQLRNAVERAVAVCASNVVELQHLPDAVREAQRATVALDPCRGLPLPEQVRQLEVARIREALASANGNRAEAARILGLPRRTLGDKLKSYSLE